MAKNFFDTIIIGAGAAGLAAADRLRAAQKTFVILEARDRVGGRVLSHPTAHVEYGPEFLHGVQPEVFRRIAARGLQFYDMGEQHLIWQNGRLQPAPDLFKQMQKLTGRLSATRGLDRSAREFSDRNPRRAPLPGLFQNYIEGFQAADMNLIGEKGLALAEHSAGETLNGRDQFLPLPNYQTFLRDLLDLPEFQKEIRLNHVVEEIDWRGGRVGVRTGRVRQTLRARHIVVTIPLALLQSGAIKFKDDVPGLAPILARLHMGHVQRLVLEFRDRWWEHLSRDPVCFIHTAQANVDFPVFWTQVPIRSNYLTAWQGGPRARAMAEWSTDKRLDSALISLATMTRIPKRRLRAGLVNTFSHDWTHDPFSRGAYSYAGLDGEAAAAKWRRPIEGKLFFAGEATESGVWRGTVEGAIQSGWRVARQILRPS